MNKCEEEQFETYDILKEEEIIKPKLYSNILNDEKSNSIAYINK
jgi:hypothetical protein